MKKLLPVLLRCLAGGLFIYAGILKVWNPAGFLTDVQNYRLLPYMPAVAFALYLPWLEIIGGACVVLKKFLPGALAILFGLVVLFLAALISAWVRGLDIACGCFGTEHATVNYPWFVLRDLAVLAMIAVLGRSARASAMS